MEEHKKHAEHHEAHKAHEHKHTDSKSTNPNMKWTLNWKQQYSLVKSKEADVKVLGSMDPVRTVLSSFI